MEKSKHFILLKCEQESIEMYKEPALKINNQFLTFDKNNSNQKELDSNENNKRRKKFKIPILKQNNSLKKLINSSSQKSLITNRIKGDIENPLSNKMTRFGFPNSHKYKNFYLTSTLHSKNKKMMNQSSFNSTRETNPMIDLIHKKETEIIIDLIKKLPESVVNAKNIDENQEANSEEANSLIKLIKNFKFDNINNQKRIEYQIIKDKEIKDSIINNNYENSKILNSDIANNNPNNNLSISMSSNLKVKNFIDNLNFYQDNHASSNKNLNNSTLDIKNNISSIIQNSSNQRNVNLVKSASTNNINNISKVKILNNGLNSPFNNNNFSKNEINFHTGFVRTQKNIYSDALKSLRKKNFFKANNSSKIKKENEKLLLPEIEEFKSIINEIEKRKRKIQQKSQSIRESQKDITELDLKDRLIEELKDIYKDQKNTFIEYLQKNLDKEENERKYDPVKVEINNNICEINKIKRKQNSFVDGYSLFGNQVNKRLGEFNYILGNKFYDRDQKKEKVEKFYKCIEKFENKLKKYRKELETEHKFYKKIYIQKIDFKKDKKNLENCQESLTKLNKVFLNV